MAREEVVLMSETLISLQNVGKTYGHVTALSKVSFDIASNSFVVVFGANGAGKSTLLKILSQQTRNTTGNVLYSGVSTKDLEDDFRAKFGVISHQPFVYENLSAYENLEFYGRLYGVKNYKERAKELLKKVDLYNRQGDAVRTFSRGMLQRISIARALIHSPEIIFLDEPYTGLDSVASITLTNLLKEQLGESKTIIMVTHDLKVGLELATHVVVMNKGKLVYNKQKSEIDVDNFEQEYLELAGYEAKDSIKAEAVK